MTNKIIIPYTTPAGIYYCFSDNSEHIFRRVVGGLAWPVHGNHGFLVVLAEDLIMDQAFERHHVHRIFEATDYQGSSLLQVEILLRAAIQAIYKCSVSKWFAPYLRHQSDLIRFNRSQAQLRQPQIRPIQPTYDPDFEYFASIVRKRIYDQKTLHFGQSVIPQKIMALPSDVSGQYFEDHPEVTALLFALAGLELFADQNRIIGKDEKTIADKTGGY